MFLGKYIPKNFCRDYVEIKGNSLQLGMFMATVLGLKPLMDDWIPVNKLNEFKKLCRRYKLKVREDIIFVNISKENVPDNVLGKENLTTTCAYGFPLSSNKEGLVHVFISKDKALLKRGMWYPVIVKKRVIFPPRIDHLKYGYVLGYPECCIKFFRKYNDWRKYSYLYEAYINTKSLPSFLCNPFLKDTAFSYIYHMPCSYSCKETIKLASKIRKEIKKREPEYVRLTDTYLKMPFLVFYEKKYYCFEGELKDNEVRYKNVFFIPSDINKDIYGEDFKKADALKLIGRRIILFKKNRIFKTIEVELNNFAPEFPFLIKFH